MHRVPWAVHGAGAEQLILSRFVWWSSYRIKRVAEVRLTLRHRNGRGLREGPVGRRLLLGVGIERVHGGIARGRRGLVPGRIHGCRR